uniref:Wsv321-like protein n=1 Tax=Trachysalambria curvirostris nimavirus TaxID=2984282 RepID=A0A9C7CFT8_9VIRU|nr:MAG: wsv321-like protein [Trachysalambria curvirostris nimavirus]
MGFFGIIVAAVAAAFLAAMLFTCHSNYLTSINSTLNLTKRLGLKGQFSPDDIKANNAILRKKLSTFVKGQVIIEEMQKHNTLPGSQQRGSETLESL